MGGSLQHMWWTGSRFVSTRTELSQNCKSGTSYIGLMRTALGLSVAFHAGCAPLADRSVPFPDGHHAGPGQNPKGHIGLAPPPQLSHGPRLSTGSAGVPSRARLGTPGPGKGRCINLRCACHELPSEIPFIIPTIWATSWRPRDPPVYRPGPLHVRQCQAIRLSAKPSHFLLSNLWHSPPSTLTKPMPVSLSP